MDIMMDKRKQTDSEHLFGLNLSINVGWDWIYYIKHRWKLWCDTTPKLQHINLCNFSRDYVMPKSCVAAFFNGYTTAALYNTS